MIKIENIHPGEILQKDFLDPLFLSQYRIAKDIKVPPRRINEIVHGKRAISADTALRLAKYFGVSAQFWLNLQTHYDLENEKDKSFQRIEKEVHQYIGAVSMVREVGDNQYEETKNLKGDKLKKHYSKNAKWAKPKKTTSVKQVRLSRH
jgi:antitoxin HigA-1